jgi:NNP family nitrate/nitrite transporter-like MFS transporter
MRGYLIPRGFGASIAATGGPNLALEVFLTFYVTCVALTWRYYLRNRHAAPGTSPKHACEAAMTRESPF